LISGTINICKYVKSSLGIFSFIWISPLLKLFSYIIISTCSIASVYPYFSKFLNPSSSIFNILISKSDSINELSNGLGSFQSTAIYTFIYASLVNLIPGLSYIVILLNLNAPDNWDGISILLQYLESINDTPFSSI